MLHSSRVWKQKGLAAASVPFPTASRPLKAAWPHKRHLRRPPKAWAETGRARDGEYSGSTAERCMGCVVSDWLLGGYAASFVFTFLFSLLLDFLLTANCD